MVVSKVMGGEETSRCSSLMQGVEFPCAQLATRLGPALQVHSPVQPKATSEISVHLGCLAAPSNDSRHTLFCHYLWIGTVHSLCNRMLAWVPTGWLQTPPSTTSLSC